MLNVEIAKDVGFCFGVKRAVKIVESFLEKGEDVWITGDLIHNEEEMERLQKLGLKTLELNAKEWPNLRNAVVVIRAHGVPLDVEEKLKRLSKTVVNATCLVVSKVASLIKKEESEGYEILLYGREGHAEVEYLKSNARHIKIVNWSNPWNIPPSQKIALFSQTTMDIDGFKKIAARILKKLGDFSEFKVHQTVCSVTVEREKEVRRLAKSKDVCIVVGGRKSSNTRKLYELAKEINARTYMVLNEKEIEENWFLNAQSVGICSGTSTPRRTIDRVVGRIKNFRN